MKKIIIALFMCMTATSYSQTIELFELTRSMRCSEVQKLIDHLAEAYGEKVTWVGKEANTGTHIALYRNEKTGSWTMIQYDGRTGCILGAGESGTPI